MRIRLILTAIALAMTVTARADDTPSDGTPPPVDTGGPWTEVNMKVEPALEFKFRTPKDGRECGASDIRGVWTDVTGGTLPWKGEKGKQVRFEVHPPQLKIDLDGDGTLETTGTQEIWSMKVLHDDGSVGPYTFHLRRQNERYLIERACMASAEIEKTPIHIVDENNDGNFDSIGEDAIAVGAAPCAQLLSRIILVKNQLYEIKPNQAGTKLKYRKWTGPTGTLDLYKGYTGKMKPTLAVVKSGDLLFDAAVKGGVKIPAGEYELEYGLFGPTRDQFNVVEKGDMKTIVVKEGETTVIDWGQPGTIDFHVTKDGPVVTINGAEPKGKGGELLCHFIPRKFEAFAEVVEDGTGRLLYKGFVGDGLTKRLDTETTYKVRLSCDNFPYLGPFVSEWK